MQCGGRPADFDSQATEVGHYNYESPHSNPIALLPDGSLLYAANTPADTVDVIDTAARSVVARFDVGLDPVGVAVRPGGREVWAANHVSDSVSVVLNGIARPQGGTLPALRSGAARERSPERPRG